MFTLHVPVVTPRGTTNGTDNIPCDYFVHRYLGHGRSVTFGDRPIDVERERFRDLFCALTE